MEEPTIKRNDTLKIGALPKGARFKFPGKNEVYEVTEIKVYKRYGKDRMEMYIMTSKAKGAEKVKNNEQMVQFLRMS